MDFLLLIDFAGPKANIQPIGQIITQPLNSRTKIEKTKKKWIDDFTVLAAFDLKKTLVRNTQPTRPVPYRGRTEHTMPRSCNILQDEVDKIVLLCEQRNQRLNSIKTKTMIFKPPEVLRYGPRYFYYPWDKYRSGGGI